MTSARQRTTWGAVVVTLLALLVGSVPVVSAQEAPTLRISIVQHPIDVRPDNVLRLVVRIDGEVPNNASVVVRVFEPVLDRQRLRNVLDGDTGPTQDRITLAWADLATLSNGDIELLVPTTSGSLERGVLRLARGGVHPLRIEVRAPAFRNLEGPVLGQVVTVVHAVTAETLAADLNVAYLATITAPPAQQPDGSVQVSPRALRMLNDLADIVGATDLAFSVGLPPETIDALAKGDTNDRDLWERLADGLAGHEVVATPAVTLNPATAVRSGLSDTYTSLLRRGEDTLVDLVGRGTVQRGVHIVDDALDVGGALLVRDLGARSLVLTPSAQRWLQIDGDLTATIDPTLMVMLPTGAASDIPAVVVDESLAQRLVMPTTDTVHDTVEFIAELLLLRYDVVERLGGAGDESRTVTALNRRSITLTTPDGSLAEPTRLVALLEAVHRTKGLRLVTASQAGASTDLAIANGLPVSLDLPATAGRDLSRRAEDMFVVSLDAFTVASMLAEGDLRPLDWGDHLWRLAAQEYDERAVEAGLDRVRALLDEVRGAVSIPSANDVTLGGRRSIIRLKLRNDATFDVRVAVRLESAKLSFPDGQELVTLPANTTTEVEIPVEVRSNGRFPVSVTLLTPEGDVPLGIPVEFAARATALTGLGQVVTVAGGLILASWWFRHGWARRRAQRIEGDQI